MSAASPGLTFVSAAAPGLGVTSGQQSPGELHARIIDGALDSPRVWIRSTEFISKQVRQECMTLKADQEM